jgi:hypothetical protein
MGSYHASLFQMDTKRVVNWLVEWASEHHSCRTRRYIGWQGGPFDLIGQQLNRIVLCLDSNYCRDSGRQYDECGANFFMTPLLNGQLQHEGSASAAIDDTGNVVD